MSSDLGEPPTSESRKTGVGKRLVIVLCECRRVKVVLEVLQG